MINDNHTDSRDAEKSELEQIHEVVMCIGCVTEAPDSDPYTVRAVKQMALRLNAHAAKAEPVAQGVFDKRTGKMEGWLYPGCEVEAHECVKPLYTLKEQKP